MTEIERNEPSPVYMPGATGEARYQALTEQGNPLAALIAAFDTERERIEASHG